MRHLSRLLLVCTALLLGEAITPLMIGCGLVILCGTALSTGLVRLGWLERATS